MQPVFTSWSGTNHLFWTELPSLRHLGQQSATCQHQSCRKKTLQRQLNLLQNGLTCSTVVVCSRGSWFILFLGQPSQDARTCTPCSLTKALVYAVVTRMVMSLLLFFCRFKMFQVYLGISAFSTTNPSFSAAPESLQRLRRYRQ